MIAYYFALEGGELKAGLIFADACFIRLQIYLLQAVLMS